MTVPGTSASDVNAPKPVTGGSGTVLDASLEGLYRQKHALFLRVARAITADSDSAHECVQEAFARAMRGSGDLQRAAALEPWVWRIVVNAARDRRRADARRRRREVGEAALEGLAALGGTDPDPAIGAAISALPERQRLVLFLRYYADLDNQTIARTLSIRPGTVGATLHAARASMRRLLEETP